MVHGSFLTLAVINFLAKNLSSWYANSGLECPQQVWLGQEQRQEFKFLDIKKQLTILEGLG
jgi:outer membrane phospholipase A